MESSAIFQAAARFFKLHQMAFLKIVSDHCTPELVTKEGVVELLRSHANTLDTLISSLKTAQKQSSLFSADERNKIDIFKAHFTKSQGDSLEDALTYFRFRNKGEFPPLNPLIPNSKRERSQLLEELMATLTA
jgi:hypothetical protein